MKQLIYAARKKGFGFWGQSENMKSIAPLCEKLFSLYYAPAECKSEFEKAYKNGGAKPDDFFPIRYKYCKLANLDNQNYFAIRQNFLGYEYLVKDRLGNKFMHTITSDVPFAVRPVEYLIGDFLRRELTPEEVEANVSKEPLAEIDARPPQIRAEDYFSVLASEQNAAHFKTLLELVVYALGAENRHIVVDHAKECKELWSYIVLISELLPIEKAIEFTFDSHYHVDFRRSDLTALPTQTRTSYTSVFTVKEKLVAFYDEHNCHSWECVSRTDEYIFIDARDFSVSAMPEGVVDLGAVVSAAAAGFSTADLLSYQQNCDGRDDFIAGMSGAAALIRRVTQFNKAPHDTVVNAFVALAENNVDEDCCKAVADILYTYRDNMCVVLEALTSYRGGAEVAKKAARLLLDFSGFGVELLDGYLRGKEVSVKNYEDLKNSVGDECFSGLVSDVALSYADAKKSELIDGVLAGNDEVIARISALTKLNTLDAFVKALAERYEGVCNHDRLALLLDGDELEKKKYTAVVCFAPSVTSALVRQFVAALDKALNNALSLYSDGKSKDVALVLQKFALFLPAEEIDNRLSKTVDALCKNTNIVAAITESDDNAIALARCVKPYEKAAAVLAESLAKHVGTQMLLASGCDIATVNSYIAAPFTEFCDFGRAVSVAADVYANSPENNDVTKLFCALYDAGYASGLPMAVLSRMICYELAHCTEFSRAEFEKLDKRYKNIDAVKRWGLYLQAVKEMDDSCKNDLAEHLCQNDAKTLIEVLDGLLNRPDLASLLIDLCLARRLTDRAVIMLLISDNKYRTLYYLQRERIWGVVFADGIFAVNEVACIAANVLPFIDVQTQDYIVGELLKNYSLVGLKQKNLDALLSACGAVSTKEKEVKSKDLKENIAFLRLYSELIKNPRELPTIRNCGRKQYARILADAVAYGLIHHSHAEDVCKRAGGEFISMFVARYGKYAKRRGQAAAWDALYAVPNLRVKLDSAKKQDNIESYIFNHCMDGPEEGLFACTAAKGKLENKTVYQLLEKMHLCEADSAVIASAIKLLEGGKSEYVVLCNGYTMTEGLELKKHNLLRYIAYLMSKKKISENKFVKILDFSDKYLIYCYMEFMTGSEDFSAKIRSIKYYDEVFKNNESAVGRLRDSLEFLVSLEQDRKLQIKVDRLFSFMDNLKN